MTLVKICALRILKMQESPSSGRGFLASSLQEKSRAAAPDAVTRITQAFDEGKITIRWALAYRHPTGAEAKAVLPKRLEGGASSTN